LPASSLQTHAMNTSEDTLTILADLVSFVEAEGIFPERARFMVKHQARIAVFDALERDRVLGRWQSRTIWTVAALQIVVAHVPFATVALGRAQRLLEELKTLYGEELEKVQPLSTLIARLGWPPNEVRCSLMLLQWFAIFHQFSVELPGYAESIGLTDGVLRLEASTFDVPRSVSDPTNNASADQGEQQIALGARDLFEKWFAAPYREGGHSSPVGPQNGTPRDRQRALLRYEYLERRALIVKAGHRFYRISDTGKELALRNDDSIDEVLGLQRASAPRSQVPLDPHAVRLHAKALFEEHFRKLDRNWNVIAEEDGDDRTALEELARKGLARKGKAGSFLIGPRGVAVCMGDEDLDQVLGLVQAAPQAPTATGPTVVNNFHGSIGAVAAAPHASAHGTVIVHQVDSAMRLVVDKQDELGEIADVLIPLLRKTRNLERATQSDAELVAALEEAEELRAFQGAVKPNTSRAVASVLTSVFELVPVLRAVANIAQ
jgi:hypothetical protein